MRVQPKNVLPNPNVAMLAQKQAYDMQRKSQADSQKRRAKEQLESITGRSTAKKSTGGPRLPNNVSPASGKYLFCSEICYQTVKMDAELMSYVFELGTHF